MLLFIKPCYVGSIICPSGKKLPQYKYLETVPLLSNCRVISMHKKKVVKNHKSIRDTQVSTTFCMCFDGGKNTLNQVRDRENKFESYSVIEDSFPQSE